MDIGVDRAYERSQHGLRVGLACGSARKRVKLNGPTNIHEDSGNDVRGWNGWTGWLLRRGEL